MVSTEPEHNMPLSTKSTSFVRVLAVSPYDEDHRALKAIFAHSRWTLYTARSTSDALECLHSNPVGVVVCEHDLPRATWKGLFDELASMTHPPRMIVTSRLADDRLWAEVINLGGFDVLAKPFSKSEVFHVISMACRHWMDEETRAVAERAPCLCAAGR